MSAAPARPRPRPVRRASVVALVVAAAGSLLPACSGEAAAVPACRPGPRLAVVAQAVPTAAYVPCIDELDEGWSARGFTVGKGRAGFRLAPGRAGARSVTVALEPACDVAGAVPTPPRAEGVRSSIRLRSISPDYAGTLTDAFPGGCVTYEFDFPRGPHIALMEELQGAVGLFSRRQLRLNLRDRLGVELDP